MQSNKHPESRPTCFVDVATNKRFLTQSTMKSDKTEIINGIEYQIVLRDVTMDSHPVYTGEKRLIDTAGRIEQFENKFSKRKTQ